MVTASMSRAIFMVVLLLVSTFTVTSMILTSNSVVPLALAQNIFSSLLTEQIKVTREISGPIDQIWNIVSNVDEETRYWPIINDIKISTRQITWWIERLQSELVPKIQKLVSS